MDHAEAHVRVMDLALEPARLREFDRDMSSESRDLQAHLATCARCRAELAAWRATIAALDTAVSTAPTDASVPATSLRGLTASEHATALPPELRARTLAAARERPTSPKPYVAASRRAMRPPAWLAMAAAVVVLVVGASAVVVDRSQQLDRARADTAALNGVATSLDLILEDPSHKVALLSLPSGTPGGTVSWSATTGTMVVLANSLQSPQPGQVYRCSIEQGGARVVVGEMHFSDSIAYWAGPLDSWGAAPQSGGRFVVSLEPTGGGSSGVPVLAGTL